MRLPLDRFTYTVHDGTLHIAMKGEGSRWVWISDLLDYAAFEDCSRPDAVAALLEPLTDPLSLAALLKRESLRLAGGDEALSSDALALASLESIASGEFGGAAGLLSALNLGKLPR